MYEKYIKRLLDFILSLIAIILLCPLLIIITASIRIMLGAPVIFKQERVGKNGNIFILYKFRTMSNKKDDNGFLLPDSARLTKFGCILRSTSLDELPELINIIKGEMSIVGPRPLLVQYLDLYNEKQKHRHDVYPGLTGYAQVNGRNMLSWEKKFELDVAYIKKLSFFLDLKIIFKTVTVLFSRKEISSETSATMEEFKGSVR